MGRSVSYPPNAVVAFRSLDDIDDSFEFSDLVDDIRYSCKESAPSLRDHDGWAGREDRILMRNDLAEIGVSEYCGLVAVWMRPRPDCGHETLAEEWVKRFAPRFTAMFGEYVKTGTMSNGESVYIAINGRGRSEPMLDRG